MSTRRSRRQVPVHRITIDERLAGDLIRVVICPLAKGVQAFFDREGDWGPEREAWVRPGTYARRLGIPAPESKRWPWEALVEGQVFLSGAFEIVGDPVSPSYFQVSSGRQEFLRIDHLDVFKQDIKRLYSDLLTRR